MAMLLCSLTLCLRLSSTLSLWLLRLLIILALWLVRLIARALLLALPSGRITENQLTENAVETPRGEDKTE